jgi:hypothetical protein
VPHNEAALEDEFLAINVDPFGGEENPNDVEAALFDREVN